MQESNKPWFTNGLANACKKKNKLYRDYLKSRSKRKLLVYKQYKNKLTNILRCEEKRFYHGLLLKHKNNTKETWKVLKNIIDKKRNCRNFPGKFMDNGHEIMGLKDIATGFNNFFTNIGPNLAKKIEPPDRSLNIYDSMLNKNVNSMFLSCITEKQLINIVRSCKNKASSDCDNINMLIIKSTFSSVLQPFLYICNLSFQTGIFPDKMKIARVIPLFKSGDDFTFNNYRPVSLLPQFLKILEKLFDNRLSAFIGKHNILSDSQYCFSKQYVNIIGLN